MARSLTTNPSVITDHPYVFADPIGNLLTSKYCIKYELGLCPKHQGAKPTGKLYLLNNGRRLALHFDCKACEMRITPEKK